MNPKNPKSAAAGVLRSCWPNGEVPVDPVAVAQKLGVDVRVGDLPPSYSGAIIKEPGSDPVILLAWEDHPNRQRFSCAHELGHYVQRAGDDDYSYIDYRGAMASQGTEPEEIFANQFAANLLMPEPIVRRRFEKSKPLWAFAREFGVSPEAMRFRLKNLGLLCDE